MNLIWKFQRTFLYAPRLSVSVGRSFLLLYSYPVGILYSSVLCVFSVFQFGCLFVVSGVNPAVSCVCPLNVRLMSGLCMAYTFKFQSTTTEQRMTPVHLTNEFRTITGDIQNKTDMHRTTNGYSCSLPSVSIFVHAQNFPTNADGQTAHHRI